MKTVSCSVNVGDATSTTGLYLILFSDFSTSIHRVDSKSLILLIMLILSLAMGAMDLFILLIGSKILSTFTSSMLIFSKLLFKKCVGAIATLLITLLVLLLLKLLSLLFFVVALLVFVLPTLLVVAVLDFF